MNIPIMPVLPIDAYEFKECCLKRAQSLDGPRFNVKDEIYLEVGLWSSSCFHVWVDGEWVHD